MEKITFGIDIGGTNTEIGIVSEKGKIIAKSRIKTSAYAKFEDFVEDLCNEIITLLINNKSDYTLSGIGIGAPNANFYTGIIEDAPNLRWKGKLHLSKLISTKFSCPVYLTNDANAAALGEKVYGGAKNINDFILITLGTGLGSGIFSNGKLVYGHDGFAGELGHTIYKRNGRPCGCGRCGCLEQYVSASGIVKTAIKFLENRVGESLLKNYHIDSLNSKHIYEAAEAGDPIALEIFDYTGKVLGFSLANIVAISSPEAIFLFGGLANSGKFIFDPTQKYMEYYMLNIFKNKVRLLPSLLPETDAAILGASALVAES
ncbi:MAG: ROK family protein [Candidatus Kapabacteria bacterium]|nr:ROK family protein [Candidatus Kapabacteria bacterium]